MIQEYYDGDGKVVVRFLAVKSLHINYAKKETPMTNYSRLLTSNCRPHSHAMLEGKSGTVSDNEHI